MSDTMNNANTKNDPTQTVKVQGGQVQDGELHTTKAKPSVPYQMELIVDQMGELFMNSTIVRQSLTKAQENPSIKPRQKKLLEQAVAMMDRANKDFLEIPVILSQAFQM